MTNEKQVAKVLENKLRNAIIKTLYQATMKVKADAQALCPVDQGILRASIDTEVNEATLEGYVFTRVKWAPFCEFGTSAHIIKPVKAKALRFEVGKKARLGAQAKGKATSPNIVFAKEVHHPGTTESPFLRPSMDMNREWIRKKLIENIKS